MKIKNEDRDLFSLLKINPCLSLKQQYLKMKVILNQRESQNSPEVSGAGG